MPAEIPGYTFGAVGRSPVTIEQWRELLASLHFSDDDERAFRRAWEILSAREDEAFAHWVTLFGDLFVSTFARPDGTIDQAYRESVGKRARRWFRDLPKAGSQEWLDYQHEIGLRHHRTKKNRTDGVTSVAHVPGRYIVAFIHHIADVRRFLVEAGATAAEADAMQRAWSKMVTAQFALWLRPYVTEGDW
jgi:hypothetical protein